MLIEEFKTRTGYTPTPEEYAEIEKAYYTFDGGKDEFCRLWLVNQCLVKNLPCGLRKDIFGGLNMILMQLYEGGYKETKHYRALRNLALSIDY